MEDRRDWQISVIPDYMLIYPNGDAKNIIEYAKKDIQELYSILKTCD